MKKLSIVLLFASLLLFSGACGSASKEKEDKIFNDLEETINEQDEKVKADSLEKKLEQLENPEESETE